MKSKKFVILATAVVMAVIVAVTGSTFAWFTATDGKKNHFETAKITDGTATLYEVFHEPKEWLPDQEVIKNVAASNTGANDILVRISFEEVLDKLTSEVKYSASPYSAGQVPVLFDATAYSAAGGWLSPSAQIPPLAIDPAVVTALGTDAANTLLVKSQVINSGSTSPSTGYSFIFWYPIPASDAVYGGQKQSAKADLYVENGVIKIVPGSLKFYAFDGRATTQTAWADFAVKQVTGATLAIPAASAIGTSQLDSLIQLNYSADLISALTVSSADKDKWFYNADDGYFYYIGNVEPGTITNLLLESVTLDKSAGSQYTSMLYDLYVNMEAIQPLESAVTASSGWNLSGANAANIIAALKAVNAFDAVE